MDAYLIPAFDRWLHQAAVLLGDDKLVAKLSERGMPAIEPKYPPICLCKLCSRAAYLQKSGSGINEHAVTCEMFMSSELKQMFISAYHHFTGTGIELHSARFKEQLLLRIPALQAHKRGKQIV